jgi:hypothetical protein
VLEELTEAFLTRALDDGAVERGVARLLPL